MSELNRVLLSEISMANTTKMNKTARSSSTPSTKAQMQHAE
jgi:hypothetical protein